MCYLSVTPSRPCLPPPPTEGVNFALRPYPFFCPPPPPSTEGLNFALRPRLTLVRLQVVGATFWLGTLPSVLLREYEEQINFSQQSPKMLKMASESLIHALLLFLGLFLKISPWVPLEIRLCSQATEINLYPKNVHYSMCPVPPKNVLPRLLENLSS